MKTTWVYREDNQSGRLTIYEPVEHYIELFREDAAEFNELWVEPSANHDELIKDLVGSKHSIHFPPRG